MGTRYQLVLAMTSLPLAILALTIQGDPPIVLAQLTADFGPQPATYNVNGTLVFANPAEGCSVSKAGSLKDMVVFMRRGLCTFIEKTLNAQDSGAIAIIIGNSESDLESDRLMKMHASESLYRNITIPSVFVSYNSAKKLSEKMRTKTPTIVIIDATNEAIWTGSSWSNDSSDLLALCIFFFLGMWFATAFILIIRKICLMEISRRKRIAKLKDLVLIKFKSVEDLESGPETVHLHNLCCAICLSDFANGDMLRALPCRHGFHGECIDPWLLSQSDLCPVCKQSILIVPNGAPRIESPNEVISRCWSSCWPVRNRRYQRAEFDDSDLDVRMMER